METTARTNTILEKKLKELEDLVEEFGFDDVDLNAYREIQLRFIFMQTLLATEISSAKYGDEEARSMKLRHMAKKLTELEETFEKQMTGSINVDDDGVVDVDETASVCSLVGSLPEEIQDASLEETVDDSVKKRKIEKIKKKRFRGLVSFGIVGFIAGMINLYGYVCDQMKENAMVLTPT